MAPLTDDACECWDDFSKLREVVVGRAEHKPVHLHDEPATRQKLDVAFGKKRTATAAGLSTTGCSDWRQTLLDKNRELGLVLADGKDRHKKCVEQVANLVEVLKGEGISVLRPEVVPGWEKPASTPWWGIDYHYGTPCPRDLFVKFGDLVVETYSGWRCRFFEGQAYYPCLEQHCERTGSRFVQMPRGVLSEKLYLTQGPSAFSEHCAITEAADIRRFGRDVFMQTGGYSNERGFNWLQRLLKKEDINLHKMTFDAGHTSYYHLDAKFTAIDEKTILYSRDHRPSKEIFDMFEKKGGFELVEAPAREVLVSPEDFTSSGLNLNMLVVAPGVAVVEKGEKGTIKCLRDREFDVIPVDFAHAFEFGGAFNCWTFDTVRDGSKRSYFQ